jgi:hypothetical protein
MKRRFLTWSVPAALLTLVLFGCATTGPAFEPVSPERLSDGSSVIYLYRPKAFAGSAGKFNLTINGLTINGADEVALTNGSYYPYVCDPGDYTVEWNIIGGENPTATLTVDEGEAYYVRARVEVTTLILVTFSKNYLEVVEPSTGREEIAECGLVE